MTVSWRARLSSVFYILALIMSIGGTASVIYIHTGIWVRGKFFFGAIVAVWVAEYLLVSSLFWWGGRLFKKRRVLDRVFYIAAVIPIAIMFILPGRFDFSGL